MCFADIDTDCVPLQYQLKLPLAGLEHGMIPNKHRVEEAHEPLRTNVVFKNDEVAARKLLKLDCKQIREGDVSHLTISFLLNLFWGWRFSL